MVEINIVYVDDHPDESLSKYIDKIYVANPYEGIQKNYIEITFDGSKGYESLLNDPRIHSANVILIDNHLFEERSQSSGKFSGKQFKVILRKLFPFIEVLIITQDEKLKGNNIILKFFGKNGEDPSEYYKKNLDEILNQSIKEVVGFESLADELEKSDDVEEVLIDKILQSLKGDNSYDSLTKEDINKFINCFKELKDSCDK